MSAQTLAWILLATIVLGFIAIAVDDWASKVIDRHVRQALDVDRVIVVKTEAVD